MEADEALKVCEELCGSYSASSIPKAFGQLQVPCASI